MHRDKRIAGRMRLQRPASEGIFHQSVGDVQLVLEARQMRTPLNILYNFHWVVPGDVARSAQAYLGFLKPFLASNGIKAMINLRGRHPSWGWWLHEERVCRLSGIAHFDATLDSRHLPSRALLMTLFDAFDAAPRPFLIKCSGGQDRTSFAAALYIVHRDGWTAQSKAQAQFARFPYLHFPKPEQHWLQQFLDHAHAEASGAPLSAWVRGDYDPARLAAWLEAKGMGGSFKGIFGRR